MTWYQYTLLSLSVVLYALSQLHIFGKLKWQHYNNRLSFFGFASDRRKYKDPDDITSGPAYFGSTTFLVMFTDFYHASQAAMKITLSIGIFNFTWSALIAWSFWTGIQWGCFKLFSK